MTVLETVRTQVLRCLSEAGISAVAAYERPWAKEQTEAVIAVDVRGCESGAAGLGDYLGEGYDEKTASWREEYGRRMELSVALDAYAPRCAGAVACAEVLEKAHEALLLQESGIRAEDMTWEAVRWDKDSGLFLRQGRLRCSVYVIAVVEGETGLLLDFKLKGVLSSEHSST